MNDNATPLNALFEKAENYTKTSIDLLKLNAIDKSADLVSSLAARTAVFLVVALFVFLGSIGLALWLGDLLGKSYYGFFAIALIYVLLAIILYTYRNQWIKNPVSDSIISQMLKQKQV